VYVSGQDPYGANACGSKAPCINYLNPAAFTLPAQGTYGNMGKGALRGPDMIDYDGALSKEIVQGDRPARRTSAPAIPGRVLQPVQPAGCGLWADHSGYRPAHQLALKLVF